MIDRGPPKKSRAGSAAAPPVLPNELVELVADVRPRAIVVGIPFSMDGSEGEMAREARAFAEVLANATGIEIVEWDERLSTSRAEREIQALGLKRSKRRQKGRSDEMAATLMLTDYLRGFGGGA